MRLTWQNLNARGSGWREGRCWLWRRSGGQPLRFEWAHLRSRHLGLTFTTYGPGSRQWQLHLALIFGSWRRSRSSRSRSPTAAC